MHLSSRTKPLARTRKRRRHKIGLEILEDRLMLSTVHWTNPAGGDWDTPGNWSTGTTLPGPGDDVVIDTPGITVTHSSTVDDAIHSLTSQAALSVFGGSLSIAAASTLTKLNLGGPNLGTLTGAGNVTVTSTLNWTGGTMKGAGTTTVAAGGTLEVSGGCTLDGRTLVNAGIASWSGDIVANDGATIDNRPGATFTINSDSFFHETNTGAAEPVFDNAGAFIKAGGSGLTGFQLFPLNNSGSIQVQSGTLALSDNGDSTGSFQVFAGAILGFGFGSASGTNTQTLEPPSRISGAGTVVFEGGTVNIQGTYDLGNTGTTQFTFGETHFTGLVASLGKVLAMSGGTADFSSGQPVTVPELDLAGGTLAGSDNVVITRTLDWTGGTMGGTGTTTIAASTTANLSGGLFLDSRTLVNAGSATWSGNGQFDSFAMNNYAVIDNLAGAIFTITNDQTLHNLSIASMPRFNNAGTLVKTGGTGVTGFYEVGLDNTGILRLESGTFLYASDLGDMMIDGRGILDAQPGTSLVLGNTTQGSGLTGRTTNADRFNPPPVTFRGGSEGTRQLEVMSRDLGNTAAGFSRNFAYDSIQVGTGNTLVSLQLVDSARNSPGTDPEALYVNTLIVPQFSTLDLSGLHVYARSAQIAGTILHGSVSIVPPGGSIALNASAPGNITASGQVNDWTFYGRAGQSVAATVHTGAGGTPAPSLTPFLNWAQVPLIDAGGHVLATAANSQSEADAAIAPLTLPADGTYHIHVQAPASHPGSLGNYVLSTYGSPIHDFPLTLNQTANGQLGTPVSEDRWAFTALAGQQVQFHLVAASSPSVQFDLTGPGGFAGFTGLTADSAPVSLPSTGTYTLTARVAGAPVALMPSW